MRNYKTSKTTIRHLEKFDFPDAANLRTDELAEIWLYVLNHKFQPGTEQRICTMDTAFKFGFICGARWQKRNPAATLARHDGKPQK